MCGEMGAVSWARPATVRNTVQALCRDSRPPRALRNNAGVAGPDQVGLDRLPRKAADRHDSLLSPFSAQQHGSGLQVEVVAIQADGFGDP